jgi:8-hydroxy-5-deazaflavin:NADPH oxidoreductase
MAVPLCNKKGAMAARKTVAIIASTNEKIVAIVGKLSLDNFRLLILSKYANEFRKLSKDIQSNHPNVELEMIDCMKDGCWEADIIILDVSCNQQKEVAELIKEVATQKIVLSFSENENNELQNLLKYSKIVSAFNTPDSAQISVCGKDHDAVLEVSGILKNLAQSKAPGTLSN